MKNADKPFLLQRKEEYLKGTSKNYFAYNFQFIQKDYVFLWNEHKSPPAAELHKIGFQESVKVAVKHRLGI